MHPRLTPGPLGLWYALAGFVASLACAMAPTLFLMASGNPDSLAMLPMQFVLFILVSVLIVRLARWRTYAPNDLGLVVPSGITPWLIGAAGGLLFVAIGQVGARLLAGVGESGQEVAQQVGFGESLARDVVLAFTVALIGPVGEEFIFRGLIFRGLFDGLSRWRVPGWASFGVAAIVSAVIFSQSHGGQGQQQQFWFLVIFGLIAAGLYWWTGSLVIAAFGHVVCNSVNVGLLLYADPPTSPLIWLIPVIAPALAVILMVGLQRLLGAREPVTS